MVRVVEVAVTQTWPPPARSRGNATRLGAEPGNATVASFRSCIAAARSHGKTAIVAAIKNEPIEARIAALHARRTTRPLTTPRCSEAHRARCHITRHGPASHLRKNRRRTSPTTPEEGTDDRSTHDQRATLPNERRVRSMLLRHRPRARRRPSQRALQHLQLPRQQRRHHQRPVTETRKPTRPCAPSRGALRTDAAPSNGNNQASTQAAAPPSKNSKRRLRTTGERAQVTPPP